MNVTILGPGAIGALVCAQLQPFAQLFAYPHRQQIFLPQVLEHGSSLLNLEWECQPQGIAPDLIVVSCKAYQVEPLLPSLLNQYPKACALMLHNGMGPQQRMMAQFPSRILLGSTTCGALKLNATQVKLTGEGSTLISTPEDPRLLNFLQNTLALSPLNVAFNDDIEDILWSKLLVNVVINPLTAFYQVANGKLARAKFQPEIELIIEEFQTLRHAKEMPPIPQAKQLVDQVIEKTANNWSSMATDVKNKRQTEIDAINGFLLAEAEEVSLSLPTIKSWYERIAAFDKS